jgi:bifunctional non-homologous end joining protein LigD
MPKTTPSTPSPQRITLHYREGASDKTYVAQLEPSGAGFLVTFAYGRRGSTLKTGAKTPAPVDYAAARKIYDQLVQSKMAKGYTPGEDGTPYQGTSQESRATGVLPQLLNPIDEAEAQHLIADSDWWMQEKLDGQRVLILKTGDTITGINRRGLTIALPEPIVACARALGGQQWLMDGEALGDVYVAFDLLEQACVDLRAQTYRQRLKALGDIVELDDSEALRGLLTAITKGQKQALLENLRQNNREGVVFKRHAAPYTPGRPASGGDQRKFKFTATASCIVLAVNPGKRSVSLELCDQDRRVPVGNVTIPAGQSIPQPGTIIDVKYLYAYPGGSLYQPVYLHPREDLTAADCRVEQLKFRAGSEEDEA